MVVMQKSFTMLFWVAVANFGLEVWNFVGKIVYENQE